MMWVIRDEDKTKVWIHAFVPAPAAHNDARELHMMHRYDYVWVIYTVVGMRDIEIGRLDEFVLAEPMEEPRFFQSSSIGGRRDPKVRS